MTTRTEATEGQAKIREAAQAIINRWDDPQWEWEKHGHTAGLIADLRNALAQAPRSSPAPSVIEAGDAMLARLHHSSPKCISGEKCVCGLAAIYERWDAAKASRPSVTAPKHMNLEDEARVWWDERYGGLNPDTTSATHERKMLAAFASHVLSLSPAAQGVTVDQIMEVFDEAVEASIEHGDEDEAQDWFDIKDVGVELHSRLSALLTK